MTDETFEKAKKIEKSRIATDRLLNILKSSEIIICAESNQKVKLKDFDLDTREIIKSELYRALQTIRKNLIEEMERL